MSSRQSPVFSQSRAFSRQSRVFSRQSRICSRHSSTARRWCCIAGLCVVALVTLVAPRAQESAPLWETGTFSILGFDPATGEIGGAVQSRVFSVGNGVLWADANVGVAATQAIIDVSYGPKALDLLRKGLTPAAIVKQIWDQDPDPLPERWSKQGRQFAVMNLKGEYAAFTGAKADDWAGHKGGKFVTAQGNILAGPEVVSKTWSTRSRRRPVTCPSGWWRRSKAVRRAAAISAVSSRRPSSSSEEGLRRLAEQRHGAAAQGRRQPRTHQGAEAHRRQVERATAAQRIDARV